MFKKSSPNYPSPEKRNSSLTTSDYSPLLGGARVHAFGRVQGTTTNSRFRLSAPLNGNGMPLSGVSASTGFTPPRNSTVSSNKLPTIQEVYSSAFYEMAPFLNHRLSRYFESLGKFRFAEARTEITQPLPDVWSPSNKLSILLNVDPRQLKQVPRRSRTSKLLRMSRKMFWQQISTPLALLAECERIYYGMYYVSKKTSDEVLHEKYIEAKERLLMVSECLGKRKNEESDRRISAISESAAGRGGGGGGGGGGGAGEEGPLLPAAGPSSPQTGKPSLSHQKNNHSIHSPPSSHPMIRTVVERAKTPTPRYRKASRFPSSPQSYSSSYTSDVSYRDDRNSHPNSMKRQTNDYLNEDMNSPFSPDNFMCLVLDLSVLIQLRISIIATYKALKFCHNRPSDINYVELSHAMYSLTQKALFLQEENNEMKRKDDDDDSISNLSPIEPRRQISSSSSISSYSSSSLASSIPTNTTTAATTTTTTNTNTNTTTAAAAAAAAASTNTTNTMENMINHTTYEVELLYKCFKCQSYLSSWQFIQTTKYIYAIQKLLKKWRLLCNVSCNGIEPPSLMWLEQFFGTLMIKTKLYYQSHHQNINHSRLRRHVTDAAAAVVSSSTSTTTTIDTTGDGKKYNCSSPRSPDNGNHMRQHLTAVSPRRSVESVYNFHSSNIENKWNDKIGSIKLEDVVDRMTVVTRNKDRDDFNKSMTTIVEESLNDIFQQNRLNVAVLIILELEDGSTTAVSCKIC